MSLGGILVILAASYFLGLDPQMLLTAMDTGSVPALPSAPQSSAPRAPAANDELASFVSVVLADTEDAWNDLFRQAGRSYREPTLVLFSDQVQSACGFAQAAMGPFYCGADEKVYIDLAFYDELRRRFRAPGDFAQAYVIAHEVGHHVQQVLGISDRVRAAKARASTADANALSVRQELQADCLAGVWAHHADRAKQILEAGDIEEALGAASAIGDDRLQRRAGRAVAPETFTHGTSEQRVRWFRIGLDRGDTESCDTFSADRL